RDLTLTHGPAVHQAAITPLRVETTLELEGTALSEVALEAFAVVAHGFDDVVGSLLVQAQSLAHARCDAEDALYVGIGAFQQLVDVFGCDAVLFGLDHRIECPAHNVEPLRITLSHHGPQGLLG